MQRKASLAYSLEQLEVPPMVVWGGATFAWQSNWGVTLSPAQARDAGCPAMKCTVSHCEELSCRRPQLQSIQLDIFGVEKGLYF